MGRKSVIRYRSPRRARMRPGGCSRGTFPGTVPLCGHALRLPIDLGTVLARPRWKKDILEADIFRSGSRNCRREVLLRLNRFVSACASTARRFSVRKKKRPAARPSAVELLVSIWLADVLERPRASAEGGRLLVRLGRVFLGDLARAPRPASAMILEPRLVAG